MARPRINPSILMRLQRQAKRIRAGRRSKIPKPAGHHHTHRKKTV